VSTKHSPKVTAKSTPRKPSREFPLVQASVQYTLGHEIASTAPEDFLPLKPQGPPLTAEELLMSELEAARLLNVDMPNEPRQFIRILEARVKAITGTRKNVILLLDDESGTYTCLNDEAQDDADEFVQAPRELTWISDRYLQELLGSDDVIHSFLHHQGNVFGIVAIADKLDGTAFGPRDEMILDQLTYYLSVQVNHFLMLRHTTMLPAMQHILLSVSTGLLSAVDSPAIFRSAMGTLCTEMPFSASQYIALNPKTGTGAVISELTEAGFNPEPALRDVPQFASLLSLFQSQVNRHTFLYLKGAALGDKSFESIFGLPQIQSVLMLPLRNEQGVITGALVLFQQGQAVQLSKEALKVVEQVSELVVSACSRAKILEKALEIAVTDELTGAVNRRGFYARFDAEVDRARRNQTPMTLAIIDVDHFKSLNDTYGHMVGDQVLQGLAREIQRNIRKSDIFCRFGGEEFTLLLPETNLTAGHDLIDRLRRKVGKLAFQTPLEPVHISFSAGISAVNTNPEVSKVAMQVISEALACADEALYEAKQLGRNRVVVAEDLVD